LYLKSLELVGFKSFAEKTKLEFDPGMTAIVGPNGCGKSNIADAIRWVLGEQSAKALRGGQMIDCIFNGTDTHKPLGMAEVTLNLSDCETALGTEYNEIMVTRRVLRTGEGQYFINKTPCRLKDIQRLFMDTGIGTDSYSVMEQGKIDMILSARPDDRRAVFEEASGITKYKADKKEAIRKLEHTEANLLRLADIIREVRRQIISLQRQAGKAKRYKSLQEKLRGLDIYATRERLSLLTREIGTLESRLASIQEQEEALQADVEQIEQKAARDRADLAAAEQEIANAMDRSMQARTELDRAKELIRVNQDRIRELRELSERDSRDADEAGARLEQHKTQLTELTGQMAAAEAARNEAERELAAQTELLTKKQSEVEELRKRIHDLGAESVDIESRLSHLQNEIYGIEAQERAGVIRRERLAAEEVELQRSVEAYNGRQTHMDQTLNALRDEVQRLEQRVQLLTSQQSNRLQSMADCQRRRAETDAQIAARRAQVELVDTPEAAQDGFPGGARALLDPQSNLQVDRSIILGSLAERIQAEPAYRTAVEAVLRAWLDAVLVSDSSAASQILGELERLACGSARVLAVSTAMAAAGVFAEGAGGRLCDHVQCEPSLRPMIEQLLHNVRVVENVSDIPSPIHPDATYVTRNGAICRGSGSFEFWMPEPHETNPLSRRHQLAQWNQELDELQRARVSIEQEMTTLALDEKSFEESVSAARAQLAEGQRKLAQQEGERHVIDEEATQARERAETVSWELKSLKEQHDSGGERATSLRNQIEDLRNRHAQVRSEMAAANDTLRFAEQERSEKSTEVTDYRVRFAERRQQVEHLASRKEPLDARIRELEALVRNRAEGIHSYQARIADLEQAVRDTEARLQPLHDEMTRHNGVLEEAKRLRDQRMATVSSFDAVIREKRASLDDTRKRKSQVDVELAEQRIRKQNVIERVAADYHITPEQMMSEPEPEWEEGKIPDRETLETTIAELRAKLEAMGPVNLVAIEEHQEHEQRYTFLTQQQDDLVKAKQQLMDLIRRINKTTTDLFSQTFEQVNANFQEMFKKLFGGGSAKLVLVNEEDVLESGIEIIARPPGKKLQTVSLLSGGERTMTAVALLFSLYMVKPSPFCLLDELDAALDEANIGRFITVVKDFVQKSQFIVITHNRQTIGAAEALYGVTMEQNGVSKIVSVKFSHHEKKAPPAEATTEPAENAPST
jgi:chromosome segregation protein